MSHFSYRMHVAQELYAQTGQLHELFASTRYSIEKELNEYLPIVRNKKKLVEAFESGEDCTGLFEELYNCCREYVEYLWDKVPDIKYLDECMRSMIWLATYIMQGTD